MASVLDHCDGLVEERFPPGTRLLVEGETTGRLYILIEGEVSVLRGDTEVTLAADPGAMFGEMSILLGRPHSATVVTRSPSRMYAIADAAEFFRTHPAVAFFVARLLAQRLNNATTYLVDLRRQFEDHGNHLSMVGDVLDTLIHQQHDDFMPGSDRMPDPRM
jgi:CRP-like cAMP-binding protein